jgi:hypothetical protein
MVPNLYATIGHSPAALKATSRPKDPDLVESTCDAAGRQDQCAAILRPARRSSALEVPAQEASWRLRESRAADHA